MTIFTGKLNNYRNHLISITAFLIGWQALSLIFGNAILPSPYETIKALYVIHDNGRLWGHLPLTLYRFVVGFSIGAALGFIFGGVAGFSHPIYNLLQPLVGTILSSPVIVVVVLAMMWFGMGTNQAIFINIFFTFPLVYMSTVEGVRMIDRNLLEMADSFGVNKWIRWWELYLPTLATAFLSGFAFAAGTAFRRAIMAELLGSYDGIGYAMAMTRVNLNISELFAWILVSLIVVILVESIMIKPIEKYMLRWRTTS